MYATFKLRLRACYIEESNRTEMDPSVQVTDIADAMMIRQLFSGLWEKGVVVVATSNRPPDHLYHKGLQRAAFLPFIEQLKERSHVHSLEASSTDYRLLKVGG